MLGVVNGIHVFRLSSAFMFSRARHHSMFSCAWHLFSVFPRLIQVLCFSALGTGSVFSRACYRFYDFVHFLVVSTASMFSRAWPQLYILPRLVPAVAWTRCSYRWHVLLWVMIGSLVYFRLRWLARFYDVGHDFTTIIREAIPTDKNFEDLTDSSWTYLWYKDLTFSFSFFGSCIKPTQLWRSVLNLFTIASTSPT